MLHYALFYTIRHLLEAEPSADLREALANTRYISVLIKLDISDDSHQVADFLGYFLFSLKFSVSIHYIIFIPSVLPNSLFSEIHGYGGSLSPSS